MNRKIISVFIASLFSIVIHAQEIILKKGLVIKKTSKVKRTNYSIDASDSLNRSAIVIEGNNIVVDFNKAVLKGSSGKTLPDQFFGTAIIIRKGKNITIKNLTAKNYKIAVRAEGIEGLTIENCDFSYNFRDNQNEYREQPVPGSSFYHTNDNGEWLRFGAAMYFEGCNKAIVKNCKVTGGQNGLMLTDCNNGQFYNNDFSFNSGIGLGLYKCSNNRVLYNKLNFNVRVHGPGIEDRWQNSAGIMVYGQSNYNTFYKNSVTHCGDGFFLRAGLGGRDATEIVSEGNRIWSNDFSYSPDCGIQTAFSSCFIYDNRVFESDNGIWNVNSFNTVITNNKFRKNRIAIAIENGYHIQIEGNIFQGDQEAIRLWSKQPKNPDSGYNKYKDSKSADYVIHLNSYNQNPVVYNMTRTDSVRIYNNRYSFVDEIFRIDSTVTNIDSLPVEAVDTAMGFPVVRDPANPFKGSARFAGRDKIMITEWGPYDFNYPIVWDTNPADSSRLMEFNILGPKGIWKIVSTKGIDITGNKSDTLPSRLNGLATESRRDVEIVLEYKGQAFVDQFGNKVSANKPYRFVFRKSW